MTFGASIMNRRRLSICCSLAASLMICHVAEVSGCLWLYGTDPHGHSKPFMGPVMEESLADEARNPGRHREQWERNLKSFETEGNLEDYKQANDYAVALVHLGELKRAISILQSIEGERPWDYVTAANLGTAMELAGDNAQALKWIKEGIRRNPESHYGTEWVHVRILETKLKLAKDPRWLETHHVLAMNFGGDVAPHEPPPIADDEGKRHAPEDVEKALRYQLHERLEFVPPPDALVGDLLADLGNLIAIEGVIEQALPVFRLAIEYGAPDQDAVQERLTHFERLVAGNPESMKSVIDKQVAMFLTITIAAILGIATSLVAVFLFRRRRRRRSEV